jgi:hypothetical protein
MVSGLSSFETGLSAKTGGDRKAGSVAQGQVPRQKIIVMVHFRDLRRHLLFVSSVSRGSRPRLDEGIKQDLIQVEKGALARISRRLYTGLRRFGSTEP